MTSRSVSSPSSQRLGLTLLELIVVLVILVALAGMLVPLLPSMVERIHTATGATNITEVTKALQVHEQLNQRYPTDFDALVDASGNVAEYLPGFAVGQITALTLSTAQRDALANAGITMLAPMHKDLASLGTTGTPTFNPYSGASFSLLTGTPKVAQVSEAIVENTVVRDSERDLIPNGDVYVIVGLGSRCSMIGKSIAEAPVHFGDGPTNSAAIVYGRYCAIFRVTRGGTTPQPLAKAVLVGVVALHADGISTSSDHIKENLDLQKSQ